MEDAMLDAAPVPVASGAPTPWGRWAPARQTPLLRPLVLYTLDMGMTFRASRSEPDSGGWLHRYRAARRPVQRPMPGLCRRSVFKFAGATRSA